MNILVTGADGYIGSNIAKTLLDMGHSVTAASFTDSNIDKRARIICCDLFEQRDNDYEFFGKPDVCIHLAWRDGFKHNSDAHVIDLPKHYTFLKKITEEGLPHLTVMGSMHEVGYHEGAVSGDTPCNPGSLYGIAKNALRQSLFLLQEAQPFTLQWLRAYYITGQDERNNSIFAKITAAAKNGQTTFPFNTGKNKYDFIDVNDLALEIALASVQSDVTGIINCCTGTPVSLKDKVESFIQENGYDIQLQYGAFPDRDYDSPLIYGDSSAIKTILTTAEKDVTLPSDLISSLKALLEHIS